MAHILPTVISGKRDWGSVTATPPLTKLDEDWRESGRQMSRYATRCGLGWAILGRATSLTRSSVTDAIPSQTPACRLRVSETDNSESLEQKNN